VAERDGEGQAAKTLGEEHLWHLAPVNAGRRQNRPVIGANSVSGRAPRGHETTMIGMIQHLLPLGWREQVASTHG
jgi:hypothetical protein